MSGRTEVARLRLPVAADELAAIGALMDALYGTDEGDDSGVVVHQDGGFMVFTTEATP